MRLKVTGIEVVTEDRSVARLILLPTLLPADVKPVIVLPVAIVDLLRVMPGDVVSLTREYDRDVRRAFVPSLCGFKDVRRKS